MSKDHPAEPVSLWKRARIETALVVLSLMILTSSITASILVKHYEGIVPPKIDRLERELNQKQKVLDDLQSELDNLGTLIAMRMKMGSNSSEASVAGINKSSYKRRQNMRAL